MNSLLDVQDGRVGTGGTGETLLDIQNLSVAFDGAPAVQRVNFTVSAGEVVGVVGESGSGKSVTMLALMGLIDAPGKVTADRVAFNGQDLLTMSARQQRQIIGRDVAMIFQDAQSSLNPSYTIGFQIAEVLKRHEGLRGRALEQRILALLEQVEIPDAKNRLKSYPHQMSGGMNQRVMIAIAVACNPRLLIADEPTTALDVTVQAQIMSLLRSLQRDRGMAMVLISHDLAVVSEMADRVAVMYAGELIERQAVLAIFQAPRHPYTSALLAAIPEHNRGALRLTALGGTVPGKDDRPTGCLFAPRCAFVEPACQTARPALLPPDSQRALPPTLQGEVPPVSETAAPLASRPHSQSASNVAVGAEATQPARPSASVTTEAEANRLDPMTPLVRCIKPLPVRATGDAA